MKAFKLLTVIFLNLFFVLHTCAQVCNCESNFAWVKQTFEQNDAGFQYIIDKKGKEAYNVHNQQIDERIKSARDVYDCAKIMTDWLHFFRKGHIGIEIVPEAISANEIEQEKPKYFPDWEMLNVDTLEFKQYLANKKSVDFEGIWDFSPYKIGIKKVGENYIGFIIDSQNDTWKYGQVKLKIYPDSAVYYMGDHSAKTIKYVKLSSKNLLFFGNEFSFIRKYPILEDRFLNSIIDRKPYFEKINSNTAYLRIPSFSDTKNMIDSIIANNQEKIVSTKNLIIDLRFNGGGTSMAWLNILPFVYTNPIRQRNSYVLSTELNNKLMKIWRGDDFYNLLNKNLGNFVLPDSEKYYITKFDTIYEFPENIAVIVNGYSASATEQFVLAARQSKKVKIFGALTAGAQDIADINTVNSPCDMFQLTYALSKDVDIDNFPIDGIGIQPDFYLDNSIQEYQWVDYVAKILNNDFE